MNISNINDLLGALGGGLGVISTFVVIFWWLRDKNNADIVVSLDHMCWPTKDGTNVARGFFIKLTNHSKAKAKQVKLSVTSDIGISLDATELSMFPMDIEPGQSFSLKLIPGPQNGGLFFVDITWNNVYLGRENKNQKLLLRQDNNYPGCSIVSNN